jgi:hypothetical protein
MARPRQSPPAYLYSLQEIEQALGFPPRTLEMLVRLGLAPNSVTGGERGKTRLWDAEALAQFSEVSAFYWSGFEMVSAARLAEAILSYFTQIYGRSRISGLYSRTHDGKLVFEIERLRASPSFSAQSKERTDDALIYAAMRNIEYYKPSDVWKDDTYFELIDRQYGFIDIPEGLKVRSLSGRKDPMQPTFRVRGLERGGDLTITQIEEEYPPGWHESYFEPNSPAVARAREIENEFFAAYDNPRGKLALNLSRAIRSAHDRIYDLRLKRAGEGGAHA